MIIRIIIFLLVFKAHIILCDHITPSNSRVFNCKTNVTKTKNDFFCSHSAASSCSEKCKDRISCCAPGLCCENNAEKVETKTYAERINTYVYIGGAIFFILFYIWYVKSKKAKTQNQNQVLANQNPPPFNPYNNYENNQATSFPTVPPPLYNETPGQYPRQNLNQNTPPYPPPYPVYQTQSI